jgi:hypothetical protein
VPLTGQGVQALDRYAYSNNNPIRFLDPSGHSIWDFIGQFSTGYVKEFTLRNAGWVSPKAEETLSVKATETDAELIGRVAADIATLALGVDNMFTGAALLSAGTAVACGTTLCAAAVATVGGGVAVAGVGVAQTAQGVMGLGGNLSLLSSGSNSSNGIDPNNITIPTKKVSQVKARGWTLNSIQNTVKNPAMTRSTLDNPSIFNKANGNPVTYYYTADGYYVVIDNVTGELVQVSDQTNKLWQDPFISPPPGSGQAK